MSWLLVSKKCGNCRNSCGAWHSWANRRQHFCEQNQDVPDTSAAHSSGIGGYHPVGLLFVLPWISEILFHLLQRWHVPWIWIQTCVCVCVCVCVCCATLSCFSCVGLFVTLWTVAYQAPLSMGFSRQEYWSGLPRPPPGDLSIPGIESCLLHLLHCRWILYHSASQETPMYVYVYIY